MEMESNVALARRLLSAVNRAATERARSHIEHMLTDCGVRIGGDDPWDPHVHNARVFFRIAREGSLGAGESYEDGDWDCEALDVLVERLMRAQLDRGLAAGWRELASSFVGRVIDRHAPRRAAANAKAHYDLGDDLYAAMLGPSMVYSCAYWANASTLDAAQEAKLELICAKLKLRPGMTLLDVGCGYGELARHVAQRHGVRVLGITNSPNQARIARERCAGLPVEIRLLDYRRIAGRFDRIVSVGMFEHVGDRNYHRFIRKVRSLLQPDGLFVLHTIGSLTEAPSIDAWFDRYIFPGAVLPSAGQIVSAVDGQFVLEDWHNFGADYDRTLMAWHANVERAWPSIAHYGERFRRRWHYYLMTSAGGFRARRTQLWQLVLSPDGFRGGYRRPTV